MDTYVAFLRGINVGGHSLIKMEELRKAVEKAGFSEVRTFIQSGNVIFQSELSDKHKIGKQVESCIEKTFKLNVAVAVFSKEEWQEIIEKAPKWWGKDQDWRHNILIMIKSVDMKESVVGIGELKPGMELLEAGYNVLYSSVDKKMISRAAMGSKMASKPIYKKMTIRNYNTANKIAALL